MAQTGTLNTKCSVWDGSVVSVKFAEDRRDTITALMINDASWLPLLSIGMFLFFASICAVIASLERILGRPIPKLRHSRAIRRNRLFWMVPISMAAVIGWILHKTFAMPSAWQNLGYATSISMFLIAVAGAVGWIVYFVLLAANALIRLFSHSN
jgi:hypothetical protein